MGIQIRLATAFDPARTLCLAVAYANPQRWKSRLRLFRQFRDYVSTVPGVRLFVGEVAYKGQPFEVTSPTNPDHLQMRADQVLWHKENILNQVIAKRFPSNWKYGAYSDADFLYSRWDLAAAAIEKLQTAGWVQLFATYNNLSANHLLLGGMNGFVKMREKIPAPDTRERYGYDQVGACGGGWAFTRRAFESAGGMLDTCITGSADWHMAFGFLPVADFHPEMRNCAPGYVAAIQAWQERCRKSSPKIGYIDNLGLHYWHGPMASRHYGTRWHILRDHGFDPAKDLTRNRFGLWQVVPGRTVIADEIAKYFASRNEDAV